MPGFVGIDALEDAPGVDIVADVSKTLPLEDGCAEVVYASHLLEHFPHGQTLELLRDWRRVLRPGGQLMVAVPNLYVIADMLTNRRGWFTPPHEPWVGAIYGGQKDAYDFHKTGFTAPWLAYLLDQAGFGDVRQVDRFNGIERRDTSHSPYPFGQNLSLNMVAVAGGERLPAELFRPEGFNRAFTRFDRVLEHSLNVSTALRSKLMDRRQRRLERALKG